MLTYNDTFKPMNYIVIGLYNKTWQKDKPAWFKVCIRHLSYALANFVSVRFFTLAL